MAGHGSYATGTVKATYGTGSSLMTLLPKLKDAQREVATTIAWSLDGATQYALEGNIAMAGAGLAWVGEFLGLDQPVEGAIKLANSQASSDGVYLVPAMSGLGAPYWDGHTTGVIGGLTRTSRAAHLARAAVEAIAYQIRDVFDAMSSAAGCDLPALHVDGAATRNQDLMQFQADLLQRPVLRSECEDLSALGTAWFGGLALGWWNSTAELERLPQRMEAFTPHRPAPEMDQLYAGWRTAVARARLRDFSQGGYK
jgi:glycerol kinase